MCFLKSVATLKEQPIIVHPHSAFKKVEETSQPDVNSTEHEDSSSLPAQQSIDVPFVWTSPAESVEIVEQSLEEERKSVKCQMLMLMGMLNMNNSMTYELIEKNRRMEQTIKELQEQLEELKKPQSTLAEQATSDYITLNPNNPSHILIQKLFGTQRYKYELVLDAPFDTQLYKERNFDLTARIQDSEGNKVLNSNPVPLTFCVYSSADESELLQFNKAGQPLLKGNHESEVYHGQAEFRKLHLREVTSYFKNGWVYFVVYPKAPSFAYKNKESSLERVIDHKLIKPLVISDVVVRAKKK